MIEYSGPGGKASGKVLSSFSSLTEHETFAGDFSAIYAALTGKEHSSPKGVTTVSQILDAVAIGKWEIVDDTKSEEDSTTTVRTLNLRRNDPSSND